MWYPRGKRAFPAVTRGFVVAAVVLAILACTGDPVPTVVPTLTAVPAPSPETATPLPTATAIPAPTPAATPTAVPTAAPVPTATPLPDAPLVLIGDVVYVVDLAVSAEERVQGLSGRPSLGVDRAMLFVYEEDRPRTFWMPDMRFPLDMVWIRSDCVVDGVTSDVPNPPVDTPRDELPRYASSGPVRFILEVNAGQAEAHGIVPGAPVRFAGRIENQWGC